MPPTHSQTFESTGIKVKQPLKVTALTTDGKKTLSDGSLAGGEQPGRHDQWHQSASRRCSTTRTMRCGRGQSVSTRLLVTTLKDATVAPDEAVQHGTDGLYAFAVNADNKAELPQAQGRAIGGRAAR